VSGPEGSEEDRRYVEQAVAAARKRSNAADLSVFDFVQRILLIDVYGSNAGWYKPAVLRFSMKFQQVTAAVMAKGLEDTAFYRYNRLVSLNEVGGDPCHFGTTAEEFHGANQERLSDWPDSMLASSTHDSKRSEDVRARINVLSEMPVVWLLRLRRWRGWNRAKKRQVDGQPAPTRNDEYLLYQTLIGTWPFPSLDDAGWRTYTERIEQYALKAAREAKEHTSWANTNSAYESALVEFTRAILDRSTGNRFLADFEDFAGALRVGAQQPLSNSSETDIARVPASTRKWLELLSDPTIGDPSITTAEERCSKHFSGDRAHAELWARFRIDFDAGSAQRNSTSRGRLSPSAASSLACFSAAVTSLCMQRETNPKT
jgi:(1->4)-alpha-D-glucan 1-alpha-D-glucosylmutase